MKPTRGGKREGAGRKPRATPREAITVRIEPHDANKLRNLCDARDMSQADWVTEKIRRSRHTRSLRRALLHGSVPRKSANESHERLSDGIRRQENYTEENDSMTPENTDTPLTADCPSAPCSRSLRARLRDVIQKFRDEEGYLLTDKSSRALGGAIAYGDMATALSKLIEKPDKVEDMMTMLCRIGYPRRGTSDESATTENFAAEIQARWSLDELMPGGWEIFNENADVDASPPLTP